MKNYFNVALFLCLLLLLGHSLAQDLNHLYKADEEGYKCFRIPSLIVTSKGTVLAFAEARKDGCGDAGDIDLVVKRSEDGGKTWSKLHVVWSDSTNTCGNPAPISDEATGQIVLLSTWNLGVDHESDIISKVSKDTRHVFVLYSDDDGQRWSKPKEITTTVKQADWTWYATGPGRGIQLQKGKYKGRLVVPCNHIEAATRKNHSHVIYSDDRGQSWKLGGTTLDGVNESAVAELSDGRLMLNMRNAGASRWRQVAISKNSGITWSSIYPDTTLVEPVCQASLIRYKTAGKKFLAFSNPASQSVRAQMTVRMSSDNGKTWPFKKVLYQGPSAYSCLAELPDGNLGCLYEAGYKKPYEGIVFEKVTMEDLKKD
jgi:sialidase-1